ncbi:MAG: biopolymer transporter ExbD [Vicinamibacteria bacterium]|jgi:biopolymer transport protein TolR|nr:biopolymer transporter ExbD [Vicinamibacteria bacterium]MBP9945147.1 biopolymer transporter ExbD [Vicinamibacteria bacterium]
MAGLTSSSDGGGGRSASSGYQSLRRKRPHKSIGEINVTPLVDVVLVLLLVFMVTAPMMSQGIDINLPTANQVDNAPEDRLTVSLDASGRAFLGNQPIALPLLEDRIRAHMAGRPTQVVYLRADESVRYGKVIEVVDLLKRCGVERIGFAYEIPKEAS